MPSLYRSQYQDLLKYVTACERNQFSTDAMLGSRIKEIGELESCRSTVVCLCVSSVPVEVVRVSYGPRIHVCFWTGVGHMIRCGVSLQPSVHTGCLLVVPLVWFFLCDVLVMQRVCKFACIASA